MAPAVSDSNAQATTVRFYVEDVAGPIFRDSEDGVQLLVIPIRDGEVATAVLQVAADSVENLRSFLADCACLLPATGSQAAVAQSTVTAPPRRGPATRLVPPQSPAEALLDRKRAEEAERDAADRAFFEGPPPEGNSIRKLSKWALGASATTKVKYQKEFEDALDRTSAKVTQDLKTVTSKTPKGEPRSEADAEKRNACPHCGFLVRDRNSNLVGYHYERVDPPTHDSAGNPIDPAHPSYIPSKVDGLTYDPNWKTWHNGAKCPGAGKFRSVPEPE